MYSPSPTQHQHASKSSSKNRHVTPESALFQGEEISVRKLVDTQLAAEKSQQENDEQLHQQRLAAQQQREQRQQNSQNAMMISPIGYSQQQQNNNNNNFSSTVNSSNVSSSASRSRKRKKNSNAADGGGNSQMQMIQYAMQSEERRRVAANENAKASMQLIPMKTKHRRFEIDEKKHREQQQQQQQQLLLKSGGGAGSNNSTARSQNKVSSSSRGNNTDPRVISSNCANTENNRIFLTEEEARAISSGKISYSVSQRTTAFGNASCHTETVQEPFCYLAINIARSLIPSISHSSMVKKVTSLLTSPSWSSKLSSGLSLLAHGCIDIPPPPQKKKEENQQQQQQQKEENQQQQQKEENKQENQKQEQEQEADATIPVVTHVQWCMLHLPIDSPTLFVSLYCPPAAELLLPLGATLYDDADYANREAEQQEQLLEQEQHQQQQHQQQLLQAQQEQKRQKQGTRKQKLFSNCVHNFIGEVFYNIGMYEGDNDNNNEHEHETDSFDDEHASNCRSRNRNQEKSPDFRVPPISGADEDPHLAQQQHEREMMLQHYQQQQNPQQEDNNYDENIEKREYQYAHEFVDDVFDNLLTTDHINNNIHDNANSNVNDRNTHSPSPSSFPAPQRKKQLAMSKKPQSPSSLSSLSPTSATKSKSPTSPKNARGIRSPILREQQQKQQQQQQQKDSQQQKSPHQQHHKQNRKSQTSTTIDTTGLQQAISSLNLTPAHRNIAMQICVAVETFLTNEAHGRKIKRIVVCAHSTSQLLQHDVVVALRSRQLARGQSRKVFGISTSAPMFAVQRKRLPPSSSPSPQKNTTANTTNDKNSKATTTTTTTKSEHDDKKQENQQQQQQPEGLFSSWAVQHRARALRLFFARLCIPVPKLSFDSEKRRGWRFVVMPECLIWALSYFASNSITIYQCLDFPQPLAQQTKQEYEQQQQQQEQEQQHQIEDKSQSNQKKQVLLITDHQNKQQQQSHQKQNQDQEIYYHPPSIEDLVRHLFEALSNVEGATDSVTGGATLDGFVLACTTLLSGLISKELAYSFWDEVFQSKFAATFYPQGQSIPTAPPVCSCCGALTEHYYQAREATFIRQLRQSCENNSSNAHAHSSAAAASSSPSSGDSRNMIKNYLKKVSQREFDAIPNDDQDWNKAFFAESFHQPHQVLAKVNSNFLPPVAALSAVNSVERTRNVLNRAGRENAAIVRLRLQEQFYRVEERQEAFS